MLFMVDILFSVSLKYSRIFFALLSFALCLILLGPRLLATGFLLYTRFLRRSHQHPLNELENLLLNTLSRMTLNSREVPYLMRLLNSRENLKRYYVVLHTHQTIFFCFSSVFYFSVMTCILKAGGGI